MDIRSSSVSSTHVAIPTTWSEFRKSEPDARDEMIRGIASAVFSDEELVEDGGQLGSASSTTLAGLAALITSYEKETTFTTRCWHAVKGFFGVGDEWSNIQSLREEQNRLLGENLIATLVKSSANTVEGYQKEITQFLGKRSVTQPILDRALFHLVSSNEAEAADKTKILPALLEKGANPNRFYPTTVEDLQVLYAIPDGLAKGVRSATAFGMYVLSKNATKEGVAQFTLRSGGLSKGYLAEPKVNAPFTVYLPFVMLRTLPVTAFLKPDTQKALGLLDQEKAI